MSEQTAIWVLNQIYEHLKTLDTWTMREKML